MNLNHRRNNLAAARNCGRKLRLESLEDRRLLAIMSVTNLDDGSLASLAGDGNLSLREAIEAINTGAAVDGIGPDSGVFGVGDAINIPANLFGGAPQTLTLTAGPLELATSVSINGPAGRLLTIDAQQNSRVFDITTTGTDAFVFSQLVVTGGRTTVDSQPGGAIRSQTTGPLRFENVDLIGNGTTGDFSPGGAVSAAGVVDLINSNLKDNYTEGTSSGGGGIFSSGSIAVTRSTVAGNQTDGAFSGGGGVFAASATLNSSTISDNRTTGAGSAAGGLLAMLDSTLIESTISGNATQGDTAAAGGLSSGGVIEIIRSTIANNHAFGTNATGGGISAVDALSLNNQGQIVIIEPDVLISGSIIADNTAAGGNNDIQQATGTMTVEFSLLGDTSGLTVSAATNVLNQDPLLGALADNGGFTQTHTLLTGSPAIDAGDAAIVLPPLYDQRGFPSRRVADGDGNGSFVIDMGSFELQSPDQSDPDFDGDGDVDGADFLRWQLGFGLTAGASPSDGDSDGDGDVDGVDLGNWSSQYGSGAVQQLAASSTNLDGVALAVALSDDAPANSEGASTQQAVNTEGVASRDAAFASIESPATAGAAPAVVDSADEESPSAIDAALEEQLVAAAL